MTAPEPGRRDEPGIGQKIDGPLFLVVEVYGRAGLVVDEVADETVVALVGELRDARVAVDGEDLRFGRDQIGFGDQAEMGVSSHEKTIRRGCDTLRSAPTAARTCQALVVTVLLLHPGAMGSSLGAALVTNGHEVRWLEAGRSAATRARAEADGLVGFLELEGALGSADLVLSVCPPEFALDVAESVADTGFQGLYLDANAVSPATARRIAEVAESGGGTAVDGGIIGPPARGGARNLLYLSGPPEAAAAVASRFDGSDVETVTVDAPVGGASATKMAFAAWTKGSAALLLATRSLAEAEGVTGALDHAWATLMPHLPSQLDRTVAGSAPKAWRWGAEMREIAATFGADGLPSGFHEAAADLFDRLADLRDRTDVELDDVLSRLVD